MSFSDFILNANSSLQQDYSHIISAWSNDAKMLSLFAKIPPQDSPAIQSRKAFWKDVLMMALKECPDKIGSSYCILNTDQLEVKFKRKGLVPLGLQAVLLDKQCWMDLDSFMALQPTKSWSSWSLTRLIAPLSYGWKHLTLSSTPSSSSSFICLPLVQEWSHRIVQSIQSTALHSTDYIMTLPQLLDHIHTQFSLNIQSQDVDILVHQLLISHQVVVDKSDTPVIIKFTGTSSSACITLVDRGIVQLKQTLASISRQVDVLQFSLDSCVIDIQRYLQVGQKEKAKYVLKRRKRIESTLTARLASLDTLETMYHKIQSSHSDAEILKAYNVGADTLRHLLAQHNVSVENVELTMDKVQQVLSDQLEIDEAVALGNDLIQTASGVDEDELEEELNQLLEQERTDKATVLLEQAAPSIPTTEPDSNSPLSEYVTPPQACTSEQLDAELDDMLARELNKQLTLEKSEKQTCSTQKQAMLAM